MPSYSVTVRSGDLSDERKVAIAQAITRAHGEVTGTLFYMAQVLVNEIAPDCYFLGGETLDGDQIFVHGSTREGRTRETKDVLIERLTEECSDGGRRRSTARLGLHRRDAGTADDRVRPRAA